MHQRRRSIGKPHGVAILRLAVSHNLVTTRANLGMVGANPASVEPLRRLLPSRVSARGMACRHLQGAAAAASEIAVAFLAIFGVAAVIVGLMGYVILASMLLMHVPVGLDAMFGSLNLQTTAEPTPPGEATVFHIASSDDHAGTSGGLRHSAIYEDPEVIRFVASWIRARLTTRGCEVA